MAANRSILQTKNDIKKIQTTMSNMARRTTRDALEVMREESANIVDLARSFAPRSDEKKDPHLDSFESWDIDKPKTGINGRYEFVIRIKKGRWFIRNGRRITLNMYAELMHNGWGSHTPYNLGNASIRKAGFLGLSTTPNTSGYYVGWKFLTRAGKIRKLITIKKLTSAIVEIYR